MNPETIHLIASALNNATLAMTEMTRILASASTPDRSLETFSDRLKSRRSPLDDLATNESHEAWAARFFKHGPTSGKTEAADIAGSVEPAMAGRWVDPADDDAAAAPVAQVAPAPEAAPVEVKPPRKRRTKAEMEAAAATSEPGPAPAVDDHVAETFGPIDSAPAAAAAAEPAAAAAEPAAEPAADVTDGEIQAACFAAAAVASVGFSGVRDLLSRYGVTKVVNLLPEQRVPFYREVKALADAQPANDLSGF